MKNHIYIFFWAFFLGIQLGNAQNYSPYGGPFTPKGDLRVLIIYAGFAGYDANQSLGDWPASSDLPTYNPLDIAYSNYSDFTTYGTNPSIDNLSKYYYDMSMGTFRIIADVFPSRINIDPTALSSWAACNNAVINKMKTDYPTFDWSPYDARSNWPNFISDNSISSSDNKPDYVIIAYRYSKNWGTQPKLGMNGWVGSGGGYSTLNGISSSFSYNGYTFDQAGYTAANFNGNAGDFRRVFYHELAHELYSCPHYNGCNNTIGNYFLQPTFDYGMMQWGGGVSITAANGWERWVLGWKDIKHDLSTHAHNGTYTLNDYITTGDVIRLKIPNTTSQYLWIENHQKLSIYDHNPWAGQLYNDPVGSDGIPDIESGIYMYVENILDNRANIYTSMKFDLSKVNGIKFLNASGNYDYLKPTAYTVNGWSNILYHFQQTHSNPISGTNSYFAFRHDYNNNGAILNISDYNNSQSESHTMDCEIINGTPQFFYGRWGGRNQNAIDAGKRSDVFQVGDIIDIGSNPTIVNYPKYSTSSSRLEPIYLNGLSVKVLSNSGGTMTIEVKYNETDLKNDVRWSGDIILSDVPGVVSNYDLNIKSGKILTINKSGIPNRVSPGGAGDFINSTRFTIANTAYMNMESNSKIVLDSSKFTIESGGTFNLSNNAHFLATNGALLHVKAGGTLILNSNSQIEAINNSNICIESGATVLFNDVTASIKVNNNEYRGSLSATPGGSLTISGTAIPTGLNYRSSVTSNSYAYFTSGRSVLRGTNSITFNTVTTLSPGSGSTLLAYVDAGSFSSNCTTVNNYRLAAINYNEFNEVTTHSHVHGAIGEQESSFSPNASSGKLILYPNPSGSYVSLELKDNVVYNATDIKLYNSTGKEVMPEGITIISPYQVHLDISNLETGIYVIRAGSNGNMASEKIIKGAN